MKRDLVSIADLDREEVEGFLELADRIAALDPQRRGCLLRGRVLATLFFEPSTRTRLSFEAAVARLGGSALGFHQAGVSSVAKGESLADTVRTVERYADAIVLRHPNEGAARLAAERTSVPVINAGDGANQHPTQTLLDLYSIRRLFGRLHSLRIAFCGDLRYSRTVHSLIEALRRYEDNHFVLVSPESLRLRDDMKRVRPGESVSFAETTELGEAVATCQVLYMTRIQRERFGDPVEYERVKDAYVLDAAALDGASPELRVLHPLPRVNEIAGDVDETHHAAYFDQVANGVLVRQAILCWSLGVEL